MNSGREIRLATRQGGLAALGWRQLGAPRVLALHGWLDNAASFVPLAPLLENMDLVALDLPGHGHSDHRHPTARYHFIDYVFDIDAALDALGWADCHFLAHSLGAAVSSIFGAAAAERVRSVIMLDAVGPLAEDADRTSERLQKSLARHRQGTGSRRHYASLAEMAAARQRVSELSDESARLICRRSARRHGGEFVWRSDSALNWVSALRMTEEQVLDLLRHLTCPVLIMQATTGPFRLDPQVFEARKNAIPNARHVLVEGHHHFHMDQPAAIADTIREFILQHDSGPKADDQND